MAVTTWNPKKVKEVKRAVEKAAGDSHGGIMVLNALLDINDANCNRLVRACLDAGRSLAICQSVGAHVALSDDPF